MAGNPEPLESTGARPECVDVVVHVERVERDGVSAIARRDDAAFRVRAQRHGRCWDRRVPHPATQTDRQMTTLEPSHCRGSETGLCRQTDRQAVRQTDSLRTAKAQRGGRC
jgi:hypothetical protein